jgi:two-component system, response regulator, stage 0 sporulation protein F
MGQKTTILYIDDEPINILVFESIFSRNYNVITAASGFEGLERLHSNSDILIVICDMKMPRMNGIEFIVQARKEFPNLFYYILSGYDITEEIFNALKNKVIIKYFCKPFNVSEIEESIKEVIKR